MNKQFLHLLKEEAASPIFHKSLRRYQFFLNRRDGFTLLEILLVIVLSSILAGGFSSLLFWQARLYSMTSERNINTARFLDTHLLVQKVLHSLNPKDLKDSITTEIASGTGASAKIFFRFDNTAKQLLWEGAGVLEQIVGTFTYNGKTNAGTTGADWQTNWATAVVQIDLKTTGDYPETLRILVHPKNK
ncbi:MAG: prepilin-type N-terminal cleavage/methylation domain-containing protein [Candidatus Riflebacteria bacterium]|nr:prepilin-type N-terminal cleavage/methylation domain-containing protein [Candidatus Riflebacteria bacterium]